MAIRRNYVNIVQDAKKRIENNTPVNNFNSQGITKAFVDILGIEMEKGYDNLEYISRAIDPTLSTGSDLDKLGYLTGESRDSSVTPADYSTTNFYFYIDPRINMSLATIIKRSYTFEERNTLVSNGYLTLVAGEPTELIIPKDHIIQNFDGTISYTTINEVRLTDNDTYVGIIATNTGPSFNVQSNVLVSHTLQQIPELRKISQYIKCTNRYPIQNGKHSLTDEEFRYNIATSRTAFTGNEVIIRRSVLSIPGIRDILYEKNKFGNGTVSILLDGISPLISQGLIDTVKEKIEQQVSNGDTIYVNAPEYIGIELNIGIITSIGKDETSVKQQVRSSLIQYVNDLPIGGELIWNRIVDVIMTVEGVQDFVPKTFKLGEYDSFNKINKNQVVLRFQNQKANLTERFYTDSGLITVCST